MLVTFALAANTFRRFVGWWIALSFNGIVRMMLPFATCFNVGLHRGYLLTSPLILCFQQVVLFFELIYRGRFLSNSRFAWPLLRLLLVGFASFSIDAL